MELYFLKKMKTLTVLSFRLHTLCLLLCSTGIIASLASCEKNIDLKVEANENQLVVEAYINNIMAQYNYVVLSRSQDYFSPNFQAIAVNGAMVSITEGIRLPDNTYQWDTTNGKVYLQELNNPILPATFRSGLYFDERLVTDSTLALRGKVGKFYLLEITSQGQKYTSITGLPQPVEVDSLTAGYSYVDDSGVIAQRLTIHYQDPDTLGNAQFYFNRFVENKNNFGWGALRKSRMPGVDDLNNGEYIHLTFPQGYYRGDTVSFYMASIQRDVYQFWNTFDKARDNNGPFSTPVTLATNIQGDKVTGCFSGFSISAKVIVIP
jgi:hypothetical protein